MQDAIVAIEDARFYDHNGIDVRGTFRALIANTQAGAVTQGGSTITQQYVKNVLAATARPRRRREAATEDSVTRKLRELRYALGLEEEWSKKRILEGYLNIAYFGSQAYGIEVAAQRYFSVPAAELDAGQAATLAGHREVPVALRPAGQPEGERGAPQLRAAADGRREHDQPATGRQVRQAAAEEDPEAQRPHPRGAWSRRRRSSATTSRSRSSATPRTAPPAPTVAGCSTAVA